MLCLVVQSGTDRFAIGAVHVVEVIPLIRIEPVSGMSRAVAGFMRYHEATVPVLDLAELLVAGAPTSASSRARMGTRIVVLNHPQEAGRLHGLRVDKAATIVPVDPATLKPACAGLDRGGLVTGVLMDGAGMILVLDIGRVLLCAAPAASRPAPATESASPWITPTLKSF